jgi:hypothetical protein
MYKIGIINSVINIDNATLETQQCIHYALLQYMSLSAVCGDCTLPVAIKCISFHVRCMIFVSDFKQIWIKSRRMVSAERVSCMGEGCIQSFRGET